ncbi:unnamed protein product [Rhizophagus irregularis]|nr:unnamed protein product [Rhizophagus irregularis]
MIVGSFWSLSLQKIWYPNPRFKHRLPVIKKSGSESSSESSLESGSEGTSESGLNAQNNLGGMYSLDGISGSGSDGISKSGSESISSEGCLKGGCGSERSLESSSKSGSASRSKGLENSSDGSNLCDKKFILKSCKYSERFSLKGSEYGEKEYKP